MSSAAPRPSATVVLLRDGDCGLEAYLVQRHGRAAFGHAWAFPGGVVDACDARVHDACRGADPVTANRLLDAPNALNYYSAAIRELFEESGVLLADIDEVHRARENGAAHLQAKCKARVREVVFDDDGKPVERSKTQIDEAFETADGWITIGASSESTSAR